MAASAALALLILCLLGPVAGGCGFLFGSLLFANGRDDEERARKGRPASREGAFAMSGLVLGPVAIVGLLSGLVVFGLSVLATMAILSGVIGMSAGPETAQNTP